MPTGFGVHQAAAVDFDAQAGGQIVCNQEFVGGVFQGEYRQVISQSLPVEDQLRAAEISVREQALIRRSAKRRAGKIEDEFLAIAKQGPKRTRIENRIASQALQLFNPFNTDFDIGSFRVVPKYFQ